MLSLPYASAYFELFEFFLIPYCGACVGQFADFLDLQLFLRPCLFSDAQMDPLLYYKEAPWFGMDV